MAQFRKAHPEVCFNLDEYEASAILSALHDRQYDLAFIRTNYVSLTQYQTLEIAQDRLQVIVTKNHPLLSRPARQFFTFTKKALRGQV